MMDSSSFTMIFRISFWGAGWGKKKHHLSNNSSFSLSLYTHILYNIGHRWTQGGSFDVLP